MKYMLLIIAAVTGCAADEQQVDVFSSARTQAKSVCEVMTNPTLYAGRKIVVHGIYFAESHQRLLYDNSCKQLSFPVEHSLQAKGDRKATALIERFRKLHRTVNIPVVYSGTFVARKLTPDCADRTCYSYTLQDARLLAASPRR
jgi:hypothetical protein